MKNALNWFELPTANFDRALKFYNTLFNRELRLEYDNGKPYALFPFTEPGLGGALANNDMEPSAKGALVYFNVEGDLDGALDRTEPAGGKIIQPRTLRGPFGFVALIHDSEGNLVGLHSER